MNHFVFIIDVEVVRVGFSSKLTIWVTSYLSYKSGKLLTAIAGDSKLPPTARRKMNSSEEKCDIAVIGNPQLPAVKIPRPALKKRHSCYSPFPAVAAVRQLHLYNLCQNNTSNSPL
ncbi:hypothetical protein J6590_056015 [Homalodisca vitripennis]|nr:hypothetical protein J6590_056015 [Homalodisca vitripennis]